MTATNVDAHDRASSATAPNAADVTTARQANTSAHSDAKNDEQGKSKLVTAADERVANTDERRWVMVPAGHYALVMPLPVDSGDEEDG